MGSNFNFKIGLSVILVVISVAANSQSLSSLIDLALTQNPEIQKYKLQYETAIEKINEANTVPNTEFSVGYFVSSPETRTGPQRFKVSAKQMLPWFGSIKARETYSESLADTKFVAIEIARAKLVASVSQRYNNLHANTAKQKVLTEVIKLLKTYETLALSSVETGKASAVDVLKLQMRQNELSQFYDVAEQQYLIEQAALNKLLNRDTDIEITVVDQLTIPADEPDLESSQLAFHPELIKFDKQSNTVEQMERLNQKESQLLFGLGLDYINVEARPDMNFSDNGKDIIMPMLSLSIPIFNQKYKSLTKQNDIAQREISVQKQERLNALETQLNTAINERQSARIKYNTQIKNINQAKNAEDILLKSYESGTIDFNDVLDIQELQLKFELDAIEALKTYHNQSAIIHYLTQYN